MVPRPSFIPPLFFCSRGPRKIATLHPALWGLFLSESAGDSRGFLIQGSHSRVMNSLPLLLSTGALVRGRGSVRGVAPHLPGGRISDSLIPTGTQVALALGLDLQGLS